MNLHILVLLEDPVGIKHGSISHFLHIRTRLWSLNKKEHIGMAQLTRDPDFSHQPKETISYWNSYHGHPAQGWDALADCR